MILDEVDPVNAHTDVEFDDLKCKYERVLAENRRLRKLNIQLQEGKHYIVVSRVNRIGRIKINIILFALSRLRHHINKIASLVLFPYLRYCLSEREYCLRFFVLSLTANYINIIIFYALGINDPDGLNITIIF